jgi:hypothetical protein
LDGGEEVGGQHVVAGGDAAEVLEAPEHVLDGVAATVKDSAEAVFPAPVPLGWDVRHGTAALDLLAAEERSQLRAPAEISTW